jgi:uncharacterized protein YjbI with pentapeptide repeats
LDETGSSPNEPEAPARRRKAVPDNKLPPIAEKADDLEAIKKAVEDAAAVSGGLWLSYLFVLFYIAVAAGAVTHVDLLLENPVKLPFFNLELPLKAFFFLAPFLFLIMHAYTLAHFVLLADKVRRFHDELDAQIANAEDIREGLRRQLPSNIFVQFLAGPKDIRVGGPGWLLKATAWTTLVFGPILLLLLLQIQFLPYHDAWITWTHRIALLIDFMLLCWLWPKVLQSRDELGGWRWWTSWAKALTVFALGLVAVFFSWIVVTFPGEWQEARLATWRFTKAKDAAAGQTPLYLRAGISGIGDEQMKGSIHDLMFKVRVDWTRRRVDSLIPNTIVLPGFNVYEALKIDDPKKVEWREALLSLRGRDLKGAVFDFATLPKVDFEGAQLEGARFIGAKLQSASFAGAQLQGASLDVAELQGASFSGAQLQGASLDMAKLQGSYFSAAQLQGASVVAAQLQGASLGKAQLQGASFAMAQLQGASFDDAQLQGGSLDRADLQGASFNLAQLGGAVLDEADLSGASAYGAQLQGASLKGAKLARASLSFINLWRAHFEPKSIEGAEIGLVVWESGCLVCDFFDLSEKKEEPKPSPEEKYRQLKSIIEGDVPGGPRGIVGVTGRTLLELYGEDKVASGAAGRDAAVKRIEVLDPTRPFPFENDIPKWKNRIETNVAENARAYSRDKGKGLKGALVAHLKTLVCSGDENAIYVLMGNSNTVFKSGVINRIKDTGIEAASLADAILKPECPVSAKLTEEDKAKVRLAAKEAAGAATKAEKDAKEETAKKAAPQPSPAPSEKKK